MPVVYQRLTDRVIATGVTHNDLIHIVIPSDVSQDPDGSSYKATIQQVFDSLSGYCVNDFNVSNIHSCSPLNINPLDEGNVYFGSESGVTLNLNGSFSRIGINNDSPNATLDIVGELSSNRLFVQTQGFGSIANISNFSLYNPTDTSGNYFGFNRYAGTIASPSDFSDGESPLISKFVGNVYKDGSLNASTQISMGTKNLATSVYNGYISFATTSGDTLNERMIIDYNGNVGINIGSPTEKLEVSGKTKTTNFQMTSGAADNYVLTSDSNGNATWQPKLHNYGSFYSIQTQNVLSAGTIYTMSAETQIFASGVTLTNGGRFTFTNSGVYNIQFSAQINKNSGTKSNVFIWLYMNGSNVPNSNTEITMNGSTGDRTVAAWNFLESFNAGEYFEIRWTATQTNTFIEYDASPAYGPAIPSVIITVSQVG